jgi:hypothetical protein
MSREQLEGSVLREVEILRERLPTLSDMQLSALPSVLRAVLSNSENLTLM